MYELYEIVLLLLLALHFHTQHKQTCLKPKNIITHHVAVVQGVGGGHHARLKTQILCNITRK